MFYWLWGDPVSNEDFWVYFWRALKVYQDEDNYFKSYAQVAETRSVDAFLCHFESKLTFDDFIHSPIHRWSPRSPDFQICFQTGNFA